MPYHSSSFRQARIKPSDAAPALVILADPSQSRSMIGTAFPTGHIGGADWRHPTTDYDPPEVLWRLQIDRAWIDGKIEPLAEKQRLDGRFVLRAGVFVELAEGAE